MNNKQLVNSIRTGLNLDWNSVTFDGVVFLERIDKFGNKEALGFPYLKFPGKFILAEYVSGWKRINEVESIVEKYYKKYSLGYNLVTIHTSSRWENELFKIQIYESEDVEKAIPYLREMIIEDILPFFDRYLTVEQVYEQMEAMPVMKMSEFIFNPMPIRRTILKALVKEKGWEEYAMGLLEYIRNEAIKKPNSEYSNMIKYLPDLIEELRQMQK